MGTICRTNDAEAPPSAQPLTDASNILRRYEACKREVLARRHGGLPSFPEAPRAAPAWPSEEGPYHGQAHATSRRADAVARPAVVAVDGSALGEATYWRDGPSEPQPEAELVEENRRLRREAQQLQQRVRELGERGERARAEGEAAAAELAQMRAWVVSFQRHVFPHVDGQLPRNSSLSLSRSRESCSGADWGSSLLGPGGLDEAVPQHVRSALTERRYSEMHDRYFPPEAGVFAVKPELERLKRELKMLRAVVDGSLATAGGASHGGRSLSGTRAEIRPSALLSETKRASWSSAGSSEVSLLQEQVHSLEDRLQHARQEELRVAQQAMEAVSAASAARRELAGLRLLGAD
eukprot:jgi/Tetstr1/446762/TSEL_034249.t1